MKSFEGIEEKMAVLVSMDSFMRNYSPFQEELDKSTLNTMNLRPLKGVLFRLLYLEDLQVNKTLISNSLVF